MSQLKKQKSKRNQTMKQQTNPNIKAHLIQSAFYLLLLLAVCAIPFALAQRNSVKQNTQSQKAQPAFQTINTYTGIPVGGGRACDGYGDVRSDGSY